MKPWEVLAEEEVLRRPWMRVTAQRVRMPDGHVIEEFHRVTYPDWAIVLCLATDGGVVLVKQYRHGVEAVSLELPSGVVDPGETPLEAAQRELLEETGYAAASWTSLGTLAPNPTRQTNHAYVFAAMDATPMQEPAPEASEDLRVVTLPAEVLLEKATAGDVIHAVHVAALFLGARHGLL